MRKMYIPIWSYPKVDGLIGLLEQFQGKTFYGPPLLLMDLINNSYELELPFELQTQAIRMGEPIALPEHMFIAVSSSGTVLTLNSTHEQIIEFRLDYFEQKWEIVKHIEL